MLRLTVYYFFPIMLSSACQRHLFKTVEVTAPLIVIRDAVILSALHCQTVMEKEALYGQKEIHV